MAVPNYGRPVHQYVRSGSDWVPMTQPSGGTGGTASDFDAAFPADGTASGALNESSGDMKPLLVDDDGNLLVAVNGGGGPATIADGADVALGTTTDAAALDATGTVVAHTRGIAKVLADVWDSVNHWFKVSIQNATLAVTQSGTWNVTNVSGTVSLPTLAATSTKQSDGTQKSQVVDGSGNVIGATSNALDINIKSGNPTTIAVTQATATNLKAQAEVYQGGTAVGAAAPLQVSLANTAANATAVKVDGSAVTQPISGTVTAITGETPKWKTGSASATFTLVAAVTSKKVKVYALSLMTVSATAVTVTFKDGASGTALATYLLQASASVTNGIAEAVSIPSTLFETSTATLLEMSFSAAVSVTYNLRYFEEA